jgi:glycosyltransferase involved in cell wall biosynthesis
MQAGIDVKILGFKNISDLKIHSNQLVYIGFATKSKIINYILNWFYLIHYAKTYDAIHIQWLPMLKFYSLELLGLFLLKKRNNKIFYTAHNIYPHDEKRNKVKKRFNKLYKQLDYIVVHTDETIKPLSLIGCNNIIRIYHGMFFDGFNNNLDSKSNKMVMLGRICNYKGIEDAIKSLKKLNLMGYDFQLHIEGTSSDEYFEKLEKIIKEETLEENIVLKKGDLDVKKLIDLYSESFVTLMPYKKIEQSGVVFTSLGLNIPVVAYNVGGLKEVIIDKNNGRLVEKGNIDYFVDSIIWTYKNQNKLKKTLKKYKCHNLWDRTAQILIEKY